MLQSPGAPLPAGSPMLPDLSNMMYMSTGAKQLPPLVPLVPLAPLEPDVPPSTVPKPPLLVPSLLLPLLPPLAPKVESPPEPHATARAMLQEIVTRTETRAGAAMFDSVSLALGTLTVHSFSITMKPCGWRAFAASISTRFSCRSNA